MELEDKNEYRLSHRFNESINITHYQTRLLRNPIELPRSRHSDRDQDV